MTMLTDPQLGVLMLVLFIGFILLGFPIAFTLMALGDRVKGGQVIGGWPIQADDDVNVNTPGPGGLIYNDPNVLHAMRTEAQPLLAIWSLWMGS